ncbi:MAG TPA: hypothetical protein VKR56_01435 [Candidatus Cybelea sp.]|nr:hypothetical protein [Candidatus Cybelea sp.]
MTRPHEDIQRHTITDHRPGGPVIAFAAPSWWAIALVNLTAERAAAGVASYETLVEKARSGAPKVREAAILLSHDQRRVIAILHVEGHEAFGHLVAAWDDHHLVAERHDIAESHNLALYRLATVTGEAAIDPTSQDAYAFERTSSDVESSVSPGVRAACMFDADDGHVRAAIYRSENFEQLTAPRAPDETFYEIRPVRTFA